MAPEYSKMVLVQMNHSIELVHAIQTHRRRILNNLLEQLNPHLGELAPDAFAFFMDKTVEILVAHLEEFTQGMGAADLNHTHKLIETQQARDHRDKVLEDTFKKVFSIKTAILGLHGEEALVALGISGETPRVPAELERWLEQLLTVIRGGVTLPPPVISTMQGWDRKSLEAVLAPIFSELKLALREVEQKQQNEKDSLTDKWQLMEHHGSVYTSIASISESVAAIAGEHELGERLRPRAVSRSKKSKRKKGRDSKASESQKQGEPANESGSSVDSSRDVSTNSLKPPQHLN